MENLPFLSLVLCVSGLFGVGTMEDLTGRQNITVICTNESNPNNEIQLWCNLETFNCSSMNTSQEKFTIDQSSIQPSDRKCVFRARGEKVQNSTLANYSCQSRDGVNASAIFSTVPDPNTTTSPVSHPGMNYWDESSKKQQNNTNLPGKEERKKSQNPPKCKGNKKKGKCPNDEVRNGRDEPECCSDDGKAKDGHEDHGEDFNEGPKDGYVRLYTAIATFAAIAAISVLLLMLAAFFLWKWKKRIEQRTLKEGGASAQKLQERDCEKKVVTVYAKATDSGNASLAPVYNPTGHIYQEIADTPQNSAEVMHNPLYIPDKDPSQEQQLESQGQPPSHGQYSLLQLPV